MFIRLSEIGADGSQIYYDFDDKEGLLSVSRHTSIFLARCTKTNGEEERPVVIKIPYNCSEDNIERLKRQHQCVIKTEQDLLPHVISILPLHNSDGLNNCALVCDYRRGISLSLFISNNLKPKFETPYIKVQTLYNRYLINPYDTIIYIIKGIVEAVKILHDNGFSHEELTTDNVLVTDSGNICLTSTGIMRTNGDFQEDIFCIGVIAYQLCVAENNITEIDLTKLESNGLRYIISSCLNGKFTSIVSLFDAINDYSDKTKTLSRFSRFNYYNNKQKFRIDPEKYGKIQSSADFIKLNLNNDYWGSFKQVTPNHDIDKSNIHPTETEDINTHVSITEITNDNIENKEHNIHNNSVIESSDVSDTNYKQTPPCYQDSPILHEDNKSEVAKPNDIQDITLVELENEIATDKEKIEDNDKDNDEDNKNNFPPLVDNQEIYKKEEEIPQKVETINNNEFKGESIFKHYTKKVLFILSLLIIFLFVMMNIHKLLQNKSVENSNNSGFQQAPQSFEDSVISSQDSYDTLELRPIVSSTDNVKGKSVDGDLNKTGIIKNAVKGKSRLTRTQNKDINSKEEKQKSDNPIKKTEKQESNNSGYRPIF